MNMLLAAWCLEWQRVPPHISLVCQGALCPLKYSPYINSNILGYLKTLVLQQGTDLPAVFDKLSKSFTFLQEPEHQRLRSPQAISFDVVSTFTDELKQGFFQVISWVCNNSVMFGRISWLDSSGTATRKQVGAFHAAYECKLHHAQLANRESHGASTSMTLATEKIERNWSIFWYQGHSWTYLNRLAHVLPAENGDVHCMLFVHSWPSRILW